VADRHGSLESFFGELELDAARITRSCGGLANAVWRYSSTPLYEDAIDLLEAVGVDAYKIASGDVTWSGLIERAARTGKPIILSTGMSSLDEIGQAMAHAVSAGCRDLRCCTVCRAIRCLRLRESARHSDPRREFGLPVGLSDHGRDPVAARSWSPLGAPFTKSIL
jgi:sialic acid synthase SpsE